MVQTIGQPSGTSLREGRYPGIRGDDGSRATPASSGVTIQLTVPERLATRSTDAHSPARWMATTKRKQGSMRSLRHLGVQAALASALLFGAGTPVAKLLLDSVSPWLLAGLLYTGSGLGLWVIRVVRRSPRVRVARTARLPLAGAVFFGGLVAPLLLLAGLAAMPASGASLLLNAEGVFTAVVACVVFKENVNLRVLIGMAAIAAGAVVLSVPNGAQLGELWPSLAVLAACLCWAIDNNLTRMVALSDATWLAAVKGGVAGPVNLALAVALGATAPAAGNVAAAMLVGFFAYGVSLVLFIVGMRHLGTARTGAYFSVAPFFGALLAVAMGEQLTIPLAIAGSLMALGVFLHLTERHDHEHTHPAVTHDHWHTHDEHHQHDHPDGPVPAGVRHRHVHTHEPLTHSHDHYPDSHHRHRH